MAEAGLAMKAAPGLMTAAEAVRALTGRFRERGLPTAELDARLLVLAATGMSAEDYVLAPQRSIDALTMERIESFAVRRLAREPVSRILGYREFWGRRFAIDPSTLDPRPDTETLVEAVLGVIDAEGRRGQPLRLLDLGTGTGCILISLLAELPAAFGVGVDIAPEALTIAGRNADAHGLGGRAVFCCGDWTAPFSGAFDFILSNPPYIKGADIAGLEPDVRDYDPRRALDGGADGFDAYRRIANEALALTAPGGHLALEGGAGQMRFICDLLVTAGWAHDSSICRVYTDLCGQDRVVVVRKQQ